MSGPAGQARAIAEAMAAEERRRAAEVAARAALNPDVIGGYRRVDARYPGLIGRMYETTVVETPADSAALMTAQVDGSAAIPLGVYMLLTIERDGIALSAGDRVAVSTRWADRFGWTTPLTDLDPRRVEAAVAAAGDLAAGTAAGPDPLGDWLLGGDGYDAGDVLDDVWQGVKDGAGVAGDGLAKAGAGAAEVLAKVLGPLAGKVVGLIWPVAIVVGGVAALTAVAVIKYRRKG